MQSPAEIPLPSLSNIPVALLDTSGKTRTSSFPELEKITDKPVNEFRSTPNRYTMEEDETAKNSRKKSIKDEYAKALDELLPKKKQTASGFKIEIHENKPKKFPGRIKIISICGGAASGKTFVVKSIRNYLRTCGYSPTIIKERNFLLKIPVNDDELTPEIVSNYDFDHYKAVDWKLFELAVKSLSEDQSFKCPIYSIFDNRPIVKTKNLKTSNVLLIEGRLFLNNDFIRNKSEFVIYLDTDCDIMLSRIILKNQTLQKRLLEDIIEKYTRFIKPNFEKFVQPTKKYADMIIYNFAGEYYHPEEQKDGFQFLNMVKEWLDLQIKKNEN